MGRVIQMKQPHRVRGVSPQQQRQRELAWMLYITEGYIANVEHALAVNAYTLDNRALRTMRFAQKQADAISVDLRAEMQR